jgi:hypothetical protein
MFTENIPPVCSQMHHPPGACPEQAPGSGSERDSLLNTMQSRRRSMWFQNHLLFQSPSTLSAETVSAQNDHLGPVKEAVEAR